MTEIWLDQKEFCAIENCSKRSFWRAFKLGYYKTHRYVESSNGRGGGKKIQIALSEAEPAAQQRYWDQTYEIDRQPTRDLAGQFQIQVSPEKLSDPKTAAQIRMISECLAVPEGAKGRRKKIKEIAELYGFNVGTAYRLMKKVKAGRPPYKGYRAGGTHFEDLGVTLRAWDEAAGRMAIEAIMANRRNKVEKLALYNKVCIEAEAKGLQTGRYESFCWLARRLETNRKGMITYRDKGIQGLRQDVVPAIRRDHTAYRPMECLVGDQHKADYYALDSQGNVVTLELFAWLDFRTQLVWPAVSLKHYNRYTVGQALINAVRWGLPSMVYTDLGKPELSNYMTHLVAQLTGIGVKTESIHHVKATGRHPQAKPIEGWFGWLDRQLKNEEIPGFCKRLNDSRENELNQKELQRQIKAGELLTVSELMDVINTRVFDRWNNHEFKNRGPDTGVSPLHIYNVETEQYPVTRLSEDMLDYIFLPVRALKIRRTLIRFKTDYFGRRSYYDRALADYTGREAEVRYDPYDPSSVWVFVDGKLVCQAGEWGMINPKIKDQVGERMAEQKRLINEIRDRYRSYLPPRKPMRRINPHEREAKKLKTVRVLKTQLEKDEERVAAVGGQSERIDPFRALYSIDRPRPKLVEDKPARSFMRLTIDDPVEEED